MKTIYLAGGCFWGMQRFLDSASGVLSTETAGRHIRHTSKSSMKTQGMPKW